jgi:osmotically-inducible protein OsmY
MHDSAQEISGRVERRLRETTYSSLSLVTCEYTEGVIILRGEVPTFYLKQLAQTIARQTDGVHHVANHIQVPTAP